MSEHQTQRGPGDRRSRRGPGTFERVEWRDDPAFPSPTHHTHGPAPCPQCGTLTVEIVYGMPGPPVWDAEERDELVIGGCILPMIGEPDHACPRCTRAAREHG